MTAVRSPDETKLQAGAPTGAPTTTQRHNVSGLAPCHLRPGHQLPRNLCGLGGAIRKIHDPEMTGHGDSGSEGSHPPKPLYGSHAGIPFDPRGMEALVYLQGAEIQARLLAPLVYKGIGGLGR